LRNTEQKIENSINLVFKELPLIQTKYVDFYDNIKNNEKSINRELEEGEIFDILDENKIELSLEETESLNINKINTDFSSEQAKEEQLDDPINIINQKLINYRVLDLKERKDINKENLSDFQIHYEDKIKLIMPKNKDLLQSTSFADTQIYKLGNNSSQLRISNFDNSQNLVNDLDIASNIVNKPNNNNPSNLLSIKIKNPKELSKINQEILESIKNSDISILKKSPKLNLSNEKNKYIPSIQTINNNIEGPFIKKSNFIYSNYPFYYLTEYLDFNEKEILEEGIKKTNELMEKISLNNQDKQKQFEEMQKEIPVLLPTKEKIEFCYVNQDSMKILSSIPFEIFSRRKNFKSKKINLVLDIDCTLIHALNFDENSKSSNIDPTDNLRIFEISINYNEKCYNLKFKIRKYVVEFLQNSFKFCNIFICTHGVEPYAKQVVKILNEQADICIPHENIIANRQDPISGVNSIIPKTLNS